MPGRTPEDGAGAPRFVRAVVLAAAVLLYVLVTGLELGTSQPSHVPSVLVAIPALVALAFGPPAIIGAAVVVAATRWAFLAVEPGRFGAAAGTSAAALAVAAVACFAVSRRRRAAARLVEVTSVAETAQRALLRPPPDAVGPIRIAASYRAAAQFARIGGDVYAVADTGFGLRVLIGDVRGKGLEAVATGAVVLGCFHETAFDHPTLEGLAGRLELSLRRYLDDAEGFVTALLVDIAPDGRLRALSCGHPPPLLLRGADALDVPVAPGLPLGLGNLPPAAGPSPAPVDVRLRQGDTVLLYTDGITEARDAAGAFYPLAERLRAHPGRPAPADLLDWLQEDARAHAGGLTHDDAALLALTWT
ncbi:PP2C family protein-serine/threonine phosphatase [Streptomyces sp. NRRL F-5123]|uniref:PP2C family protein-serine/threonine phosphatase n=1 Tax=Streptomyces sp. NRRL F-5123 TaxID=1463856 RepID=UPI0004E0FDFD|nr:PP2C family protein-serine/threonine phosphatase [Streptomyces sp. NRRL F-5123]